MALLRVTAVEGASLPMIWAPLALVGGGVGLATVALYHLVLQTVPQSVAGAGSGALQAFQQIGIALGIALAGQVFFASLGTETDPRAFVAALKTALLLPVGLFATLVIASLKLKPLEGPDAPA
ncbi:hypothetical protein P5P81_05200 [Tritonibacter mobilis]|nr:hypothetical protein [Tritonibacter mobilis]